MSRRERRRRQFWLDVMTVDEFARLAKYNTERSHGIVHAPEYVERMARLQERYTAARLAEARAQGHIVLGEPA